MTEQNKARPLQSFNHLDQSYLKDCFEYNESTGVFIWKKRPLSHFKNTKGMNIFNAIYSGTIAGTIDNHGYARVQLNGKKIRLHQIAWIFVYGLEPLSELDHINNDRLENRITNIRLASSSENQQNQIKAKSNNTYSKKLGVHWHSRDKKFSSKITINGETHYLGYFKTEEDASSAYLKAKHQFHPFSKIIGVNNETI